MLAGLPDGGGSLHATTAVYLTLLQRLRLAVRKLKARPDVGIWTDDYSNLLRVSHGKY